MKDTSIVYKHSRMGCIITVNSMSEFTIHNIDSAFTVLLGINHDCTNRPIDSCFDNVLCSHIKSIYRTYIRTNYNNRPQSFMYRYEHDGIIPMDFLLTVYRVDNMYNIECVFMTYCNNSDLDSYIFSFQFCFIEYGDDEAPYIVYMTPSFVSFMNNSSLTISRICSFDLISTCHRERKSDNKMLLVNDIYGRTTTVNFTCIPSPDNKNRLVLFANDVSVSSYGINISSLSARELDVVKLASKGLTNRAIASMLRITDGTVKKILSNAYRKLNVSSKMEIYDWFQ